MDTQTMGALKREVKSRVTGLLAGYLIASRRVVWPGTDGLTVDEVEMEYLPASAAGCVPPRQS